MKECSWIWPVVIKRLRLFKNRYWSPQNSYDSILCGPCRNLHPMFWFAPFLRGSRTYSVCSLLSPTTFHIYTSHKAVGSALNRPRKPHDGHQNKSVSVMSISMSTSFLGYSSYSQKSSLTTHHLPFIRDRHEPLKYSWGLGYGDPAYRQAGKPFRLLVMTYMQRIKRQ